jgi:hypothetical protein
VVVTEKGEGACQKGFDGVGQDLQSFIGFLEKHHPDEVLHVTKEVDPIFEATTLLWALENQRRYPVAIFDNIKGCFDAVRDETSTQASPGWRWQSGSRRTPPYGISFSST